MLKFKIRRNNEAEHNPIRFNLDANVNFEQEQFDYARFLKKESLSTITPIFDNEIKYFSPLGFETLVINLQLEDNLIFYSDLGYNDDDIALLTNRFLNSRLRINFYTSSDPANQVLFYQVDLNNQLNPNNNLTSTEQMPMFFIADPNKTVDDLRNSLGYKIPYFKNPNNNNFPIKLYAEFQYLNSVNGEILRLISSSDDITFDNLYDKLYVTYELISINDKFLYTIDQTDRNIYLLSGNKVIDLNIINEI